MSLISEKSQWPRKPLIEVSKLQRGFDLPVQDRVKGVIPVIAANGPIATHAEAMCKGPGVVTGRSGTIGKVHYVESDYWPLNTSLFVVDFCGNHPKWVYHLLSAFGLERFAQGAGVPTLNRNLVHSETVAVPPPEVQKRIALTLDKIDDIRRKRLDAMRLVDDFVRLSFVDMFGRLNAHPDDLVRLGDVVSLDAPMVDPRNDEFAAYLHVGPDRIEKSNGQILECKTAREEGLISKKFLFDERYVLYSKIRPALKKCALVDFSGLCSADMYPIRPTSKEVPKEFIWGLLLSDVFDSYVATLPGRANIPKLNRNELAAFQFCMPPKVLRERFAVLVQIMLTAKKRHQEFAKEADRLFVALGYFN